MRRSLALTLTLGSMVAIGVPAAFARAAVDKTHLPVGKTSTSAKAGALWSCQTTFSSNAAGAFKEGPWFNGDGTWDSTTKVHVSGSITWPSASLVVKVSGADRVLTGNALPSGVTTGVYPIASTDQAYNYDRNPNSIRAQTISLKLTASPKVNTSPQCVGGEVGIALDGPPIFSAIDAGGRDAQAYEVQDSCDGHPQESGVYHYHGLSPCADRTNQFGWALDGFAIWGPVDPSTGKDLTNDDLDACHGTTSPITIDGRTVTTYHYVANDRYPYTVGCFRGTPSTRITVSGGAGGGPTGGTAAGGSGNSTGNSTERSTGQPGTGGSSTGTGNSTGQPSTGTGTGGSSTGQPGQSLPPRPATRRQGPPPGGSAPPPQGPPPQGHAPQGPPTPQ